MSRLPLIEIDLRNVVSEKDLHLLLMNSLGFPGWYGCNWDAFWDAISGLVEMPIVLRFVGWQSLASRLPRATAMLAQCLGEMEADLPMLASNVEYV